MNRFGGDDMFHVVCWHGNLLLLDGVKVPEGLPVFPVGSVVRLRGTMNYSLNRFRNLMVELSGRSALQHSFDNSVFIIPAVVVVAIVALVTYKLTNSIKLKQKREKEKRRKREEKSKKRS